MEWQSLGKGASLGGLFRCHDSIFSHTSFSLCIRENLRHKRTCVWQHFNPLSVSKLIPLKPLPLLGQKQMKAKLETSKGLLWTSSGLFLWKERIPFYFMLCLFYYPSKHECEGCLCAINECTLERSTCLQWDLRLFARKSSSSSGSHAYRNSLAEKTWW